MVPFLKRQEPRVVPTLIKWGDQQKKSPLFPRTRRSKLGKEKGRTPEGSPGRSEGEKAAGRRWNRYTLGPVKNTRKTKDMAHAMDLLHRTNGPINSEPFRRPGWRKLRQFPSWKTQGAENRVHG